MYEFHVAKNIRDKYNLQSSLFEFNGNVVLADFLQVRLLAQRINELRSENLRVSAGELNAVGLMDEIFHSVFALYQKKINPGAIKKAYKFLENEIGESVFNFFIGDFVRLFPPKPVYSGEMSVEEYLKSANDGTLHTEISLEELIMLFLSNANPAADKLKELFDSNHLGDKNTYLQSVKLLQEFFKNEPKIGPDSLDIISFFKQPFELYPDDLAKQLLFIKENWKVLLDDDYLNRILSGGDLFKEEFKLEGFDGIAPTAVPQYKPGGNLDEFAIGKSAHKFGNESIKDYEEPEQFTPDIHWMPNVVLIAKNTYVWMDQLSKKYGREIKTLDQIPDEELDLIAGRNFNSIWLIGVWERSSASRRIKHIMGNIDAVASAYSLYDYTIASDLGGESAYGNLNERCRRRGIRLASDMVPNHTGIYSDWTLNHPEYFVQRKEPPYPNYKFTGENLSEHPDIELRIEDGYYTHSDAAVVFEWKNNKTGEVRYIYHGNDGTNMPWNDTAQLNMLKAEVREAVINKIMEVARRFSIIRFDAAMTLAKKHFRRLWYPKPGTGGDIPSRTEYSMTDEEFDEFFPKEFWREVVDKINNEMPDTLLLAEAFWLMEGYFVRTLGMHRVYNSAFMHMMMNEENDKYRKLITNTLEFDPEILKRYVNFMSNPDEETAIKQFGVDDKYFGVCVMMSTLPGLPMFAHGQIEGYTEKYGMEYKRAYYNENPKDWLIERHNKEIFPLLQKRYLFSDANNFWLYDFIDDRGAVNENVFAFTNSVGDEKTLVLYNNKYERASGVIFRSTNKIDKNDSSKKMSSIALNDALGVRLDPNYYYICKELTSHREYLFGGDDFVDGLHFELNGFDYKVFYGFTEVYDKDGELRKLKERLQNESTPSVKHALASLKLLPVQEKFENIFDENFVHEYVKNFIITNQNASTPNDTIVLLLKRWKDLLKSVDFAVKMKTIKNSQIDIVNFSYSLKLLNSIIKERQFESKINFQTLPESIVISKESRYYENTIVLMLYRLIRELTLSLGSENYSEILSKLELFGSVENIFRSLGRGARGVFFESNLLFTLLEVNFPLNKFIGNKVLSKEEFEKIIRRASADFAETIKNERLSAFIAVNEYKGVKYYSKENFEELLNWFFTISALNDIENALQGIENIDSGHSELFNEHKDSIVRNIEYRHIFNRKLIEISDKCAYRFDELNSKLLTM